MQCKQHTVVYSYGMQTYSANLRPSDCTMSYVSIIAGIDAFLVNLPLCLHKENLTVHVIMILPPVMVTSTLPCTQN